MNKLATTILSCLLASTALAVDVDRTVDASDDGHVDVSNISGAITVEGWNQDKVEVTGTIGRNVKELIVERDGNKVLVKVKLPKSSGHGTDADLLIKVPKNSSVNVGTVSADIDVTEVTGDQSLHSVSGNVTTEYTGADTKAESVSGDVDVTGNGADGEIIASTVSGDVTLVRVAGDIEAESVSGDVSVEESAFEKAEFSSVNGDIDVSGELREDGKLVLDTVNGDIDIDFAGNVSAEFDIDTFNGSIRNCFGPKPERTSKYAPGLELEFTHGSGDGTVVISTMNGNISFCND